MIDTGNGTEDVIGVYLAEQDLCLTWRTLNLNHFTVRPRHFIQNIYSFLPCLGVKLTLL